MVVEPVQDLDLGPVGQAPVGEVGLPQLVGRGGLEPDPGAARALTRLGDDEPCRVEDAPDGRGRRDGETLAPQVPADRDRTGVVTTGGELGAEREDPHAHGVRRPARVGLRPSGAWLERIQAAVAIASEQALQMLPAHPVLGRGGGDG